MLRSLAVAVSLTFATSALAQAGAPAPSRPYAVPAQPAPAPYPAQAAPAQPVPAPYPAQAAPAQPVPAPSAAQAAPSYGTGSSAMEAQPTIPSAPGGGSQQVVVNPPAQQPAAPPPAPATSVMTQAAPMVVEHDAGRPTLEIVAVDAAYGALAGALVGGGVALIDQGNNLGRNLLVGAGAGILVGAVVGSVQAYSASRASYATDGLGTPERDPPLASAHTVASYSGRF